jgi:hypothetical protein
MDSFDGYEKRERLTLNKVGLLIDMFKETHTNAPKSDFERLNGRMAGIYKLCKGHTEYAIEAIWCSCAKKIEGSHLDYITKSVKARAKIKGNVKLIGHAGMEVD